MIDAGRVAVRSKVYSLGLVLAGLAIGGAWGLLVLPIASIAGPVPGKEWLAYGLLLLPPALASGLLITGGFQGARQRAGGRGAPRWVATTGFGVAALLGLAGVVYTALLARAVL